METARQFLLYRDNSHKRSRRITRLDFLSQREEATFRHSASGSESGNRSQVSPLFREDWREHVAAVEVWAAITVEEYPAN